MPMTLEQLSDHEEIRQTIYGWFRAADRLDIELARAKFWEDGGFDGGPDHRPSREFIGDIFGEGGRIRTAFEVTNHYMMNMVIDYRGDHAITETYAIAYHRVAADRRAIETILGPTKLAELGGDVTRSYEFVLGLRYIDRLEKRGGTWKIARKKLLVDWNQVAPYSGLTEGGVYGYLKNRGSRGDRSDPSYEWL